MSETKIYVYLKGASGQTLCGYFDKDKLRKLVKHFVECEPDAPPPQLPPSHEAAGIGNGGAE